MIEDLTCLTDAQLAALAIDHGVSLASTDADFARLGEVNRFNPLTTNAEPTRQPR